MSKTQQKWPWVILIVSLQLAALLLAVVFLFDWFEVRTESTLGNQVVADNHTIAEHVIQTSEFSRSPNGFQATNSNSVSKLRKRLNKTQVPNNGLIALISTEDGTTITHNNILFRSELGWSDLAIEYKAADGTIKKSIFKEAVSVEARTLGGQILSLIHI